MLLGLEDPKDLVKMLRTPTNSNTARTGPPAITPVPYAAGFKNTRPAPNFPVTV